MEYDVAIIGGGPGGSSTAIRLRQLGFRVLLLEKDRFPREKLCGEFLSPEVSRLLAELGLESELLQACPAPIHLVRLHLYGEARIEIPLPTPALGLSRASLDHMLLRHASRLGVEVLEQTTAETVRRRTSGEFAVTYRTSDHQGVALARAVVCAAGRWNRWRAQAFANSRGQPSGRTAYGFKAHYGPSVARPNTLDLHFFPGGYCGVSHVENDRANVCCLIQKDLLRACSIAGVVRPNSPQADPIAVVLRQPSLGEQLLGGKRVSEFLFTGPLVFHSPRPVDECLLMVGDSAAFVDPFCGDGISIAVRSGSLAAQALKPLFQGKWALERVLSEYARAYQQAFRRQFFWARWLRRLASSRQASSMAARLGRRSDWLRSKLFAVTRSDEKKMAEFLLNPPEIA